MTTDWKSVIASGLELPEDANVNDLVSELIEALRSPDPTLRDDQAYVVLANWILRGVVDDMVVEIGDRMSSRFADKEIQARTFAPLILVAAVRRDSMQGVLDADRVRRWRDTFADWYLSENDLRGRDDRLGWLHAVAHGADLIGALAGSDRMDRDDLRGLLDLGARRMTTGTGCLFACKEDDRLAEALALVLLRPELSAEDATRWLGPIADRIEHRDQATVEVWLSNSVRTLRALYVLADRGIRTYVNGSWTAPRPIPHNQLVKDSIAEVLRIGNPSAP